VGGPAEAPNRVGTIGEVEWELLNPGDTVRIHWRAAPYAERIMLIRSGTASQPIRVCGVPGGPANQRPSITGIEATTRPVAAFRTSLPGAIQPFGVMTISGKDHQSRVEHLIVEGLRIGDTKSGPGRNTVDDNAHFFDAAGVRRRYDTAAACIRMRQAHHVTLRNNEITNCGDGLFAGSVTDSNHHVIRHLTVEGNYIHDNAIIGNESRHQAYLQGVDITVQGNYFGPARTRPEGVASGNQLKMRVAGAVVRYNYLLNGARTLDIVEAEEHIVYVAPWQYARFRQQYLACQALTCLRLGAAELAEYDLRQQQDWQKYQNAYIYGNLIHVRGRSGPGTTVPSNVVHYGFDNSQHDRQPGTLWFFHNTVLWQTDYDNKRVMRLFDYGSDYGGADRYNYNPVALKNSPDGTRLHYISQAASAGTCQTLAAGCVDWGPMLQTRTEDFGRMRAFHNAVVRMPFSTSQPSDVELTRYRWDKLDFTGPNWITAGWDTDTDVQDGQGGGYGRRLMPENHIYPGGNDAHHITGVHHLLTGNAVPIDTGTFAPLAGSPLRSAATPLPTDLPASLRPAYSVTLDPTQPNRVVLTPRSQWSTLGAVE
jgi:hypothetical protein